MNTIELVKDTTNNVWKSYQNSESRQNRVIRSKLKHKKRAVLSADSINKKGTTNARKPLKKKLAFVRKLIRNSVLTVAVGYPVLLGLEWLFIG